MHEGPARTPRPPPRKSSAPTGLLRSQWDVHLQQGRHRSPVLPRRPGALDRNNHKSSHHGALVLGGGIPVYLPADRNPQGLIGPIDPDALDEDRIRAAIRAIPLVTDPDRWQAERPFRLAIIEQCSYDGTIYNARTILTASATSAIHPVRRGVGGLHEVPSPFSGHHAMGLDSLGPDDPGIIATQSTHKQLAGLSQASQIHLKSRHIEGQLGT